MTAATTADPWGVESVRVTLFPVIALQGAEIVSALWRGLAGAEPEETSSKPSTATHVAQGPFNGGRLLVAAQPGRIDLHWVVEPQPTLTTVPVSLGTADTVLREFAGRAAPRLEDVPPLLRLAFGCVLLQHAESREAGYRALARYLPTVQIDPVNSSDFSYQINRPRPAKASGVDGQQLNRLSKWSVAAVAAVPVGLGTTAGNQLPTAITARYSPRVEIDTSTAVDGRELPQGSVGRTLHELVSLSLEIASKGDTP